MLKTIRRKCNANRFFFSRFPLSIRTMHANGMSHTNLIDLHFECWVSIGKDFDIGYCAGKWPIVFPKLHSMIDQDREIPDTLMIFAYFSFGFPNCTKYTINTQSLDEFIFGEEQSRMHLLEKTIPHRIHHSLNRTIDDDIWHSYFNNNN